MKLPVSSKSRLCAAVLFVSCLILAGCSTSDAKRSANDARRAFEGGKPHLLYLLSSPHSRLYVEVDAVQGNEPTDVALEKLRAFLATHCRKPDGIEIVRSDVIPADTARGISPKALARRFINGPATTNASPPAFMYVLYYSYPLSRNYSESAILHRGAGTQRPRPRQNANPYAEVYPYPAIYFNTGFALGLGGNEILVHEAGHLLGMVDRQANARGGHCLNSACYMNDHVEYIRQFRFLRPMLQSELCAECVAELRQRSTETLPSNSRYVGPVLVRSEADYHVLSLPARLRVIVGAFNERACQDFAAALRTAGASMESDDIIRLVFHVGDDVLGEPAKLSHIVARLTNDFLYPVRAVGAPLFLQACSDRYRDLGQYSNAVETLRQTLSLNPKNPRTYNSLAWIKATCPDASIRNGAEAVAAATKACELADWKNWRFIDTLAAAHAADGNFNRAVEMQEQALRTGNPTESEKKAMRERLALYKQSQPFREKLAKSE
jgi:tetratricopeptide (TPR) repeat protein